jgi:hypothetical protein
VGKWIEKNPFNGTHEVSEFQEDTGKLVITKHEDVEPLLDHHAELRNTRATDIGIKKGLWHYASIPVTVQYDLLKRGINIFRAEDRKKMFDVINSEYPHLKTTHKTHSYKHRLTPKTETSPKPGPLLIVR